MTENVPDKFRQQYDYYLKQCKEDSGRGFRVFQEFRYDTGEHPISYKDYECLFATRHLNNLKPETVLDIGSHRQFIIGVLASFAVTRVDVRHREAMMPNETVVVSDAKDLDLPDNAFDALVSLSTIEHFGLGRYGDEFDLEGDTKAFNEMVRVLKPGGALIFTTTITANQPSIAFNAHRIYSYDMLHDFCQGLVLEEEQFFSHDLGDYCTREEITTSPTLWDIYLGCWKKA